MPVTGGQSLAGSVDEATGSATGDQKDPPPASLAEETGEPSIMTGAAGGKGASMTPEKSETWAEWFRANKFATVVGIFVPFLVALFAVLFTNYVNTMNNGISDLKADLRGFRSEMKAEMTGMKTEMKADMTGMKTEMTGMKTELKAEMLELRTDLKALSEKVNEIQLEIVRRFPDAFTRPSSANSELPRSSGETAVEGSAAQSGHSGTESV
jgi:hypothetical protein